LGASLISSESKQREGGLTRLRRLIRAEYENTIRDLFDMPGIALAGELPPDGFRNWVSLDQYAAEQIGNETRYPSLVLAMSNEGSTLSYTRSGAPIPSERSPRKLFEKLFHQGKPA
jgi:hypothetical protein